MATIESPSEVFAIDPSMIIEDGQNGSHSVSVRFLYPEVTLSNGMKQQLEHKVTEPDRERAIAQMMKTLSADWTWANFHSNNGYRRDPLIATVRETLSSIIRSEDHLNSI